MSDPDVKTQLLEAAKPHVAFDGWSEATFRAAAEDAGLSMGVARAACPRGAVDLALAFHEEGDAAMLARMEQEDLGRMRYSARVAAAVRFRLEAVEDKELVRRGVTLFALPHHALDGARAIWGTCDRIWEALGDTSDDVNWYTKRATLSGVYSSTVLYWLGDESEGHARTWDFLDRRIEDVMQIEKVKAKARENRVVSGLMAGPLAVLSKIRKPAPGRTGGLPGRWTR
ncbi:COQ9 family protein [Roseovarius atlanticus]|uniref:COQ9 family protein n=1 Tax=Roseovarius atlanticus TaxID=1641875 RepID=UPI001C971C8A|nr:COQ9 family protein [Roseovarius atlanticus]MBY5986659.1 COQ9 family protein [Roseovarius atlanticus]MBY6125299.1 COQ9 family protein [Roseovarius atlanticus]MBY6150240.1 COQ9 family protein [Roseovarius atlanticus]